MCWCMNEAVERNSLVLANYYFAFSEVVTSFKCLHRANLHWGPARCKSLCLLLRPGVTVRGFKQRNTLGLSSAQTGLHVTGLHFWFACFVSRRKTVNRVHAASGKVLKNLVIFQSGENFCFRYHIILMLLTRWIIIFTFVVLTIIMPVFDLGMSFGKAKPGKILEQWFLTFLYHASLK